jgi:predicted CXXCH cytochrome family protein
MTHPDNPGRRPSLLRLFSLLAAAIFLAFLSLFVTGLAKLPALQAKASSPIFPNITSNPTTGLRQETDEYCLTCHGNPDLSMTLPSGEALPLYVSPDGFHQSVHGAIGIDCQVCHTGITTYPHPPVDFSTRQELKLELYQSCQKCHEAQYSRTQDSIHAQELAQGNPNAPVCTDCHGAHEVREPDEPRAHISETCGQCHTQIFEEYKGSVHGAALIEEDNPDVPVCTDCHGVHDIHDPRTEQFRVETPELCAGCHADAELMGRYGISADVYNVYMVSWHGVDVSVFKARWPNLWHNSAVCTDCHGEHKILATENPASHVNPANMLATCQKCHPGAGPNWTGAWTGHYRISVERTPFVYYTQVFYSSFAYGVLALSAIYVLLQIVRTTIERVRRSL